MSITVLGLDPGKTGAAVILFPDNTAQVLRVPIVKMPKPTPAWREWALTWAMAIDLALPEMIVSEQVGSMPKQGVTSTFNFGRSYGFAHGVILASTSAPLHFVTPAVWKGKMGLLNADKSASREKARNLMPALTAELTRVKDDGVAEAALIAYYGRKYL